MKNIPIILLLLSLIAACDSGPKVVEATSEKETSAMRTGIFADSPSNTPTNVSNNSPFSEELHKVVINEILPASRYVYLKVSEEGNEFWIATRKQEVKEGETYYYVGGLLKTDFESKEYNRVFDQIYLVSKLVTHSHGGNGGGKVNVESHGLPDNVSPQIETSKVVIPVTGEGFISIADLVKSPEKYEGQRVKIQGKCVKINPNIMNLNWIHLQDGTADDYDLVITSTTFVAEGTYTQIEATVTLDKDFGAGYKYSLILENGQVVK